jgi:hypothetical protein
MVIGNGSRAKGASGFEEFIVIAVRQKLVIWMIFGQADRLA